MPDVTFQPQTELTLRELERMCREARKWVSKDAWTETSVFLDNFISRDEKGIVTGRRVIAIDLHYREPGGCETHATFLPMRCPNCGRLFLASTYWEAGFDCPYKTCERKGKQFARMSY